MRFMFTADWAFAFRCLVEQNVRNLFPQLLRSWPLLQSFDSEAYALPDNYVLFVMRDKLSGTPAGPSQTKPFPFPTHPRIPPRIEDLPLWQFYIKDKFALRPADAGFLVPGHDCGRNDASADYDLFTPEEQFFWNQQLQHIVVGQKQWLESIMTSNNASTITYNFSGLNARVNVGSNDSSSNVVRTDNSQLFIQLRERLASIQDEQRRTQVLSAVDEMEKSAGSGTFVQHYQKFIGLVADHIGVFGPLIPALTALIWA